MSTCTCKPCGREFTGLAPFDKHHDVNYSRRPAVACMDPASLGLAQNMYGRWGFPADADSRERLAGIKAERALAHTPVTPDDAEAAETRTGATT